MLVVSSFNMFQQSQRAAAVQLHPLLPGAARPASTTPTQSTDGVTPVISASDSTSTTSSSLGAAFVGSGIKWNKEKDSTKKLTETNNVNKKTITYNHHIS